MKECEENDKAGEKTLVLFSYGGHGIQFSHTLALCNTIERKKVAFPLEMKIRILSTVPNTYVVAFFDCSRESMTPRNLCEGKAATSFDLSLGNDAGEPSEQENDA